MPCDGGVVLGGNVTDTTSTDTTSKALLDDFASADDVTQYFLLKHGQVQESVVVCTPQAVRKAAMKKFNNLRLENQVGRLFDEMARSFNQTFDDSYDYRKSRYLEAVQKTVQEFIGLSRDEDGNLVETLRDEREAWRSTLSYYGGFDLTRFKLTLLASLLDEMDIIESYSDDRAVVAFTQVERDLLSDLNILLSEREIQQARAGLEFQEATERKLNPAPYIL